MFVGQYSLIVAGTVESRFPHETVAWPSSSRPDGVARSRRCSLSAELLSLKLLNPDEPLPEARDAPDPLAALPQATTNPAVAAAAPAAPGGLANELVLCCL
ncbi:hypothetical protein AAFF_G00054950 [Aldrovandia affinis]|uniref:Uncharacterized protein n=1 Tax=Aldrovandia affinis TaxID=143900 RepID=A0AAD7S0Y8_9TELE|nr:hypothetical protein AAFF_G00054950 [Aldrovandia affinis]